MSDNKYALSTMEVPADRKGDNYPAFLEAIQRTFDRRCKDSESDTYRDLYVTNVPDLWDIFMRYLSDDPAAVQHYNCNTCKSFIRHYGNLVTIDPDTYELTSVLWDPDAVPDFFRMAVSAMATKVENARIIRQFYTMAPNFGFPMHGGYNHMAITKVPVVYRVGDELVETYTHKRTEDYELLTAAVEMFPETAIGHAIHLMRTMDNGRQDKFLTALTSFYDIAEYCRENSGGKFKAQHIRPTVSNYLWYQASTSFESVVRIKNSVVGAMMEDIVAGMTNDMVLDRFKTRTMGTNYQRPQAAPNAGNIAEAEKLVAEKGIAPSLKRRYAKLEEVRCIWVPTKKVEPEQTGTGVFSHLIPKDKKPKVEVDSSIVPGGNITWKKFERDVLSIATRIELKTPLYSRGNFGALLTAVHEDAPPIIAWDKEDARNPVSWLLISNGDVPTNWSLERGKMVDVTGITYTPNMWQPGYEYIPTSVFFLLDGCHPVKPNTSLGLFPEILKDYFRPIRSTMELFSKNGVLEGLDDATACGLAIGKIAGGLADFTLNVRVTTKFGRVAYCIDRWE